MRGGAGSGANDGGIPVAPVVSPRIARCLTLVRAEPNDLAWPFCAGSGVPTQALAFFCPGPAREFDHLSRWRSRRYGEYADKHQKKVFEDVLKSVTTKTESGATRLMTPKNSMDVDGLRLYATKWVKDPFRFKREDTHELYDRMIETAAIAAAACESVLRQRVMNGKTFHQPD